MRVFDSPLNPSTQQSSKYKKQQSPILKLANFPDTKTSNHLSNFKTSNHSNFKTSNIHPKVDNVLNDRSNEVFIPSNASKYIQEPFETKANREKEIDEIRKKYYEHPDHKNNRPSSQIYDRYAIYREKEQRTEKKNQNHRQIQESRKESFTPSRPNDNFSRMIETTPNKYLNNKTSTSYTPQYKERQRAEVSEKKQNIKPLETSDKRKLHINTNLDRISQASNSNYETVNKTLESFSPQKNRHKPSIVNLDSRGNSNNINVYLDGLKNKENYSSLIKETTSTYGDSIKKSNGRSSNLGYRERENSISNRQQAKIIQIESRVEPYSLKAFAVEDSSPMRENPRDYITRQPSRQSYGKTSITNYPTIYDGIFSKNNALTTQKQRQIEISVKTRNIVEQNKVPIDKVKEIFEVPNTTDIKNHQKRKIADFGTDDRLKDIEKRLKEREQQFRKKQQALRTRVQSTQLDKATRMPAQLKTPQNKQNVDREIERLSFKIKQFEDRKKELNILSKGSDTSLSSKIIQTITPSMSNQIVTNNNFTSSEIERLPSSRDFQDARKALEEYRQSARPKSSAQVHQIMDYRIPLSLNNQESATTFKTIAQETSYRKRNELIEKKRDQIKRCDFLENTKPMYSERTLPVTPTRHQESTKATKFGFQLVKIQSDNNSDELSSCRSKITNISASSRQANDCKSQFEMHRRTDDGIEQRKKRLQQNNKSGPTQEIKRLVAALSQQLVYDEEFRNCKIWFQNQRDQKKWKDLRNTLKEYGSDILQYNELKDGTIAQFHIYEDENNPFFSVNQQSKFTYQALVKAFAASKKHWKETVVKKFDRNGLKCEGFSLEKFDLQKKGYINLEDLVRFLNFESGNFYRNRDLVLIFKRFSNERAQKPDKSLKIDRILDVVCSS